MKKIYLLIETYHKRGDNRDLKEVVGCFETAEDAEHSMMEMVERINNGELDGCRNLTYKNADWNLVARRWGANESRLPRIYVNASVYKDGVRHGDLYIDIKEIEVGKLTYKRMK